MAQETFSSFDGVDGSILIEALKSVIEGMALVRDQKLVPLGLEKTALDAVLEKVPQEFHSIVMNCFTELLPYALVYGLVVVFLRTPATDPQKGNVFLQLRETTGKLLKDPAFSANGSLVTLHELLKTIHTYDK